MQKRNSLTLKSVSLCLALTFGLSDLSFAAPGGVSFGPQTSASIQINPAFGKLAEISRFAPTDKSMPLVIHIQDAHTNSSAQKNISGILESLVKQHGVKTVFVEGGSRNDSLTFLRPLLPASKREIIANKYLMKGELSGAEYLSLASDLDFELEGIEDKALYQKGLQHYAALSSNRAALLDFLEQIQKRADSLKRKNYPKTLLELDQTASSFEKKEISFSDYYEALAQASAEAHVNLLAFPYFSSLKDLKALEKKLSAEKTPDPKDTVAYLHALKNFSFSEVDKLLDEIDSLKEEIFDGLLPAETHRLYHIDRHLALARKLAKLQITSTEYRRYVEEAEQVDYRPLVMMAYLNRQLVDLGRYDQILGYTDTFERCEPEARAFYEVSFQRDQAFLKNISKKIGNQKTVALVAGGFHTANLKELLRRNGYAYAVVMPFMDHETNVERYEKLLFSGMEQPTNAALASSANSSAILAYTERPIDALKRRAGVENEGADLYDDIQAAVKSLKGARLSDSVSVPLAKTANATSSSVKLSLPWRFWLFVYKHTIRKTFRFRVEGVENLPENGGYLLAGNHIARGLDTFIVSTEVVLRGHSIPRPVTLGHQHGYLEGWLRKEVAAIVVGSGRVTQQMSDALSEGDSVVIFPAGTPSDKLETNLRLFEGRSTRSSSGDGERGEVIKKPSKVAHAAITSGAPIVPFYLQSDVNQQTTILGLFWASIKAKLTFQKSPPPFGYLTLAFGEPISVAGENKDRLDESAAGVRERLKTAIRNLDKRFNYETLYGQPTPRRQHSGRSKAAQAGARLSVSVKPLPKKILIANRGEIAVRIIRAAKALGIKTVAVYSDADREGIWVRLADEAVNIGPAPSKDSYLNINKIIGAAKSTGADAIHPGYGFLSENAELVRAADREGLTFIGPTAAAMDKLEKTSARALAMEYNTPVAAGSKEVVADAAEVRRIVADKNIKYPIALKAAYGGGGKGIRRVASEADLDKEFAAATSEAKLSFGRGELFVEKFIDDPRHIEVQVAVDKDGNILTFPARECSIQRRNQKLIEESPSPVLSAEKDAEVRAAARRLLEGMKAQGVPYHTVGTLEFLMDAQGNFYFMEMNKRIQVEHTITEEVTGVDLVQLQIALAAGRPLLKRSEELQATGHSIEVRINAEDPDNDFKPSPGNRIDKWIPPTGEGVRVDTYIEPGKKFPTNYDSMIAKLIVTGKDRAEAIARLKKALGEFVIEGPGVKTTISLYKQIVDLPAFQRGEFNTNSLAEWPKTAVECKACHRKTFREALLANANVCPVCGKHAALRAREWVKLLTDRGSAFEEINADLESHDFLGFEDDMRYGRRIAEQQAKVNEKDAVLTGVGLVEGQPVAMAVMDFAFMGGAMGSVVGEKITRLVEYAGKNGLMLLIVSSSGGARMQEGTSSMMQLPKISHAIEKYRREGGLYVSYISHPTAGGVSASFAFQGDAILAEPRSTISFAGERVIRSFLGIRHDDTGVFPPNFQRAEDLLARGLLHRIVDRRRLREVVADFSKVHDIQKSKKRWKPVKEVAPVDLPNPYTPVPNGKTPYDRLLAARSPERPRTADYISAFGKFIPRSGDGRSEDDPTMVGGLVLTPEGRSFVAIGTQKYPSLNMVQLSKAFSLYMDGKPLGAMTAEETSVMEWLALKTQGRKLSEWTGDERKKLKQSFDWEIARRRQGMPQPSGYQKAYELMKMADLKGLPVVMLLDTPGAWAGIEAEQNGISRAIAKNLLQMARLQVPIITVITSEGGSGGAIAIGMGNRVLMLENAYYALIAPEAASSILFGPKGGKALSELPAREAEEIRRRVKEKTPMMATHLGIIPEKLLSLDIIDEIIPEPAGGAQADRPRAIQSVRERVMASLDAFSNMPLENVRDHRYNRYRHLGYVKNSPVPTEAFVREVSAFADDLAKTMQTESAERIQQRAYEIILERFPDHHVRTPQNNGVGDRTTLAVWNRHNGYSDYVWVIQPVEGSTYTISLFFKGKELTQKSFTRSGAAVAARLAEESELRKLLLSAIEAHYDKKLATYKPFAFADFVQSVSTTFYQGQLNEVSNPREFRRLRRLWAEFGQMGRLAGDRTAYFETGNFPYNYLQEKGADGKVLGQAPSNRKYTGKTTLEEQNAANRKTVDDFWKKSPDAPLNAASLSTALDLPTQRGYDSDDRRIRRDVSKVGVPVSSVSDMRAIMEGVYPHQVSYSFTINETASIVLGMYLVVAEEKAREVYRSDELRNFVLKKLKKEAPATEDAFVELYMQNCVRATVQNDIFKERLARNAVINALPIESVLRLSRDIFGYVNQRKLGRIVPISLASYHFVENGAEDAAEELVIFMANAMQTIELALEAGMTPNQVTELFSFFVHGHKNLFEQAAKFRVQRKLWAKMVEAIAQDKGQTPSVKAMRGSIQVYGGGVITAKEKVTLNTPRLALARLGGYLGLVNGIDSATVDEPNRIPVEETSRAAVAITRLHQDESGMSQSIDWLRGSAALEYHQQDLERRVAAMMRDLLKLTEPKEGSAQPQGYDLVMERLKLMMARGSDRVNRGVLDGDVPVVGRNVVLGVQHRYPTFPGTVVPPRAVSARVEAVRKYKEERSAETRAAVAGALAAHRAAFLSGENVMPSMMDALKKGATLGEISAEWISAQKEGGQTPKSMPAWKNFRRLLPKVLDEIESRPAVVAPAAGKPWQIVTSRIPVAGEADVKKVWHWMQTEHAKDRLSNDDKMMLTISGLEQAKIAFADAELNSDLLVQILPKDLEEGIAAYKASTKKPDQKVIFSFNPLSPDLDLEAAFRAIVDEPNAKIALVGYPFTESGMNGENALSVYFTLFERYKTAAQAAGIPAGKIHEKIVVYVGVSSNMPDQIAKFIAIRKMFPADAQPFIIARTSQPHLTGSTVYENQVIGFNHLLIAAMSGVDAIELTTYTGKLPQAEGLLPLIFARDMQEIGRRESGVREFANPLDGDYYIQALADEIVGNVRENLVKGVIVEISLPRLVQLPAPQNVEVGDFFEAPVVLEKQAPAALNDVERAALKAKPPKVLVSKMGLDGHSRGAELIARALRDKAGAEVVYYGLNSTTPDEIVRVAIDEDIEIIGLSSLAGTHMDEVPEILELLEKEGLKDQVAVIVGGTISNDEKEALLAMGVKGVFQPDSNTDEIALFVQRTALEIRAKKAASAARLALSEMSGEQLAARVEKLSTPLEIMGVMQEWVRRGSADTALALQNATLAANADAISSKVKSEIHGAGDLNVSVATAGIPLKSERFDAIRANVGYPPLSDVPVENGVDEFEMHVEMPDGSVHILDFLRDTATSTKKTMTNFMEKRGEGTVQQVEVWAKKSIHQTFDDLKRAADPNIQILDKAPRFGANGSLIFFVLVTVNEDGKSRRVLVEFIDRPKTQKELRRMEAAASELSGVVRGANEINPLIHFEHPVTIGGVGMRRPSRRLANADMVAEAHAKRENMLNQFMYLLALEIYMTVMTDAETKKLPADGCKEFALDMAEAVVRSQKPYLQDDVTRLANNIARLASNRGYPKLAGKIQRLIGSKKPYDFSKHFGSVALKRFEGLNIGVKFRHWLGKNESISALAAEAGIEALSTTFRHADPIALIRSQFNAVKPEMFGVATHGGDQEAPGIGVQVNQHFNIGRAYPTHSLRAYCVGLFSAIHLGIAHVATEISNVALIVIGEIYSLFLSPDSSEWAMFGDLAAAATLVRAKPRHGIHWLIYQTDSSEQEMTLERKGRVKFRVGDIMKTTRDGIFKIHGPEVGVKAGESVEAIIKGAENFIRAGIHNIGHTDPEKIDWYVFHQANKDLITKKLQQLGIWDRIKDKVLWTIEDLGNTSAASPLSVLHEHADKLKEGQLILVGAFGDAFTYGGMLITWGGAKALDLDLSAVPAAPVAVAAPVSAPAKTVNVLELTPVQLITHLEERTDNLPISDLHTWWTREPKETHTQDRRDFLTILEYQEHAALKTLLEDVLPVGDEWDGVPQADILKKIRAKLKVKKYTADELKALSKKGEIKPNLPYWTQGNLEKVYDAYLEKGKPGHQFLDEANEHPEKTLEDADKAHSEKGLRVAVIGMGGIGSAVAQYFAKLPNVQVVVSSRSEDADKKIDQEMKDAGIAKERYRIVRIENDTDAQSYQQTVIRAASMMRNAKGDTGIDLLFVGLGRSRSDVADSINPADVQDEETLAAHHRRLEDIMDLNVKYTRAAVEAGQLVGAKTTMLLGSVHGGHIQNEYVAGAYGPSKAAIARLAEALGEGGISLDANYILSPMTAEILLAQILQGHVELGYAMTPLQVAQATSWLVAYHKAALFDPDKTKLYVEQKREGKEPVKVVSKVAYANAGYNQVPMPGPQSTELHKRKPTGARLTTASRQKRMILNFSDIEANTLAQNGGKGHNMVKLVEEQGVERYRATLGDPNARPNPPPFFVLTADGYQRFLEANGLHDYIFNQLQKLNGENAADIAESIQQAIHRAEFPKDLEVAIENAFQQLRKAVLGKQTVAEALSFSTMVASRARQSNEVVIDALAGTLTFKQNQQNEVVHMTADQTQMFRTYGVSVVTLSRSQLETWNEESMEDILFSVAVRSSGTREDLEDAASAGIQETFLNVSGIESVKARIKDDFASLYGYRAIDYRDTQLVNGVIAYLGPKYNALLAALQARADYKEFANRLDSKTRVSYRELKAMAADKNLRQTPGLDDLLGELSQQLDSENTASIAYDFLHPSHLSIAVVVQEYLKNDRSYTAFTTDNGWTALSFQKEKSAAKPYEPRIIRLDMTWGKGESLVGGIISPDTYVIHIFVDDKGVQHVNILEKILGTKKIQYLDTNEVLRRTGFTRDEAVKIFKRLNGETVDFGDAFMSKLGGEAHLSQVLAEIDRLSRLDIDEDTEVRRSVFERLALSRESLLMLSHVIKAFREKDVNVQTLKTYVPAAQANAFAASDEEVKKVALEVYQKSAVKSDIRDLEGGLARLKNGEAVPVTLQSRAYTGEKDTDKPRVYTSVNTFVEDAVLEQVNAELLVEGQVGRGAAVGRVFVIDESNGIPLKEQLKAGIREAERLRALGEKLIIVTRYTTPDYNPLMKLAAGVIAIEGGNTSHAAIVSREYGIATVVGIGKSLGELKKKDRAKYDRIMAYLYGNGNLVTIEANYGLGFKVVLPISQENVTVDIDKLPKLKNVKVGLIVQTPAASKKISKMAQYDGLYGVSLARAELILEDIGFHPRALEAFDNLNRAPDQLNERQRADVEKLKGNADLIGEIKKAVNDSGAASAKEFFIQTLARGVATNAAAYGIDQKMLYRATDFKQEEMLNLKGGHEFGKEESDFMIGDRGIGYLLHENNRETFGWELEAIKRCVEMGYTNVGFFYPFVRTPEELARGLERINFPIKHVGAMVEVPSTVVQADKHIAQLVSFAKRTGSEVFLSIGTNDLTMLSRVADRENPRVKEFFREADPAVVRSIVHVALQIAKARKANPDISLTLGLCGQAVVKLANKKDPDYNPELAKKLMIWLDSVGTDPAGLIPTIELGAEAEKEATAIDVNMPDPIVVPTSAASVEEIHAAQVISGKRLFTESLNQHPLEVTLADVNRVLGEQIDASAQGLVVFETPDFDSRELSSLTVDEERKIKEVNPALGFGGLSLLLSSEYRPVLLQMFKTLKEKADAGRPIAILLTDVRDAIHLDNAIALMKEAGLEPGKNVLLGLRTDTPDNYLMSEEYFPKIQFYSIDDGLLAQRFFAADRTHPSLPINEADEERLSNLQPVKNMLSHAAAQYGVQYMPLAAARLAIPQASLPKNSDLKTQNPRQLGKVLASVKTLQGKVVPVLVDTKIALFDLRSAYAGEASVRLVEPSKATSFSAIMASNAHRLGRAPIAGQSKPSKSVARGSVVLLMLPEGYKAGDLNAKGLRNLSRLADARGLQFMLMSEDTALVEILQKKLEAAKLSGKIRAQVLSIKPGQKILDAALTALRVKGIASSQVGQLVAASRLGSIRNLGYGNLSAAQRLVTQVIGFEGAAPELNELVSASFGRATRWHYQEFIEVDGVRIPVIVRRLVDRGVQAARLSHETDSAA